LTGTRSQESPLARLVLFMVCLSVAGSIAGGMYYAAGIPAQRMQVHEGSDPCPGICSLQNADCHNDCLKNISRSRCQDACDTVYEDCIHQWGQIAKRTRFFFAT
jgi:hypothetical protein